MREAGEIAKRHSRANRDTPRASSERTSDARTSAAHLLASRLRLRTLPRSHMPTSSIQSSIPPNSRAQTTRQWACQCATTVPSDGRCSPRAGLLAAVRRREPEQGRRPRRAAPPFNRHDWFLLSFFNDNFCFLWARQLQTDLHSQHKNVHVLLTTQPHESRSFFSNFIKGSDFTLKR